MNQTEAICFDDILLAPQHSKIESRKEVNLSMRAGGLKLNFPIIAAPMDTVCDDKMSIALAARGGLGVIHRHQPIESQVFMIKSVINQGHKNVFGSIGIDNDFLMDARRLINAGASGICIDVANGHNVRTINAVRSVYEEFGIHVMAGNVATGQGYLDLAEAGAKSVRVGIGGGSMCTTRLVTGHGLPTLQSVIEAEVARSSHKVDCAIVADGGIRNSGDMIKAFALGADFVMVGSMLAGTNESPGEIIGDKKVFRGMASRSAQSDTRGNISVVEGAETMIPLKGPVDHILNDIAGGLRSGCSYSGTRRLSELWLFADIRRISANSISENIPHGASGV